MDRHVEDRPVYAAQGGDLRQIGKGVTHYRAPWEDHMVGEGLRHELIAAGAPATVLVTYYPDTDELDVAVPGDDRGALAPIVEQVIGDHQGTEAADHRALLEFAGSVREAARAMAEGGHVSPAERDIVVGILAGRLV